MKKIISIFLILSLVSGCDKVNILKPIQPVKNNTIAVEKIVEVEKVLEVKEKIPSVVRFVLNHPYVSAVFAIAVMVAGGSLAYRLFGLKEKRSNLNVKAKSEFDPDDINRRANEWLGWYCQQNGLNFDELLSLHHSTTAFQAMFLNGARDPNRELRFQAPAFYNVLFPLLDFCNNSMPAEQFNIILQAHALICELSGKDVVDVPDLKVQLLSTLQTYLAAAQTIQECVSSCFIPNADKVVEAVHIYLDYVNILIQFSQGSIATLEGHGQ